MYSVAGLYDVGDGSMSKMIGASTVTLTGMFIVLTGLSGPATAQASDAAANWKAMTKCAAIADDDARHECSDKVLHNAGLLKSAETAASEAHKTAPSEPRKAANLATPEPRSRSVDERSRDKESDKREPFHVTLTKAEEAGNGKLFLTDTNGTVWRQLFSDSEIPRPKAGQSMKVRENVFGGYICRIGNWPSFRCKPNS